MPWEGFWEEYSRLKVATFRSEAAKDAAEIRLNVCEAIVRASQRYSIRTFSADYKRNSWLVKTASGRNHGRPVPSNRTCGRSRRP